MKLTNKQKEVLMAINQLTVKTGHSPTLRELMEYLGYNSISAVPRHTEAIKNKGFLTVDKFQQRSLTIKKSLSSKQSIPLVGTVACGQPILAVENIIGYIPYGVKGDPKNYFFLKAAGDSMNKAGINNGDFILVKKQSDADPGEKVIALVGDEATVKFYKKEDGHVVLEPKSTNPIHKPLHIFEDLQILGKVITVLKP